MKPSVCGLRLMTFISVNEAIYVTSRQAMGSVSLDWLTMGIKLVQYS